MSADKNSRHEDRGEARERVGKGAARELRRSGLLPAVIYGDKQAPISITLNTNEVTKRIHAGGFMTTVATIDVAGKKFKVLPKDYQLDSVRDFTMHEDFLRVSGNTQVTVEIPVHFANEDKSPGLKAGGVLNIVRHEVEVRCPADAIPEAFMVDLSGHKIGDSIHMSRVTLPKGVTPVITDRDFTIATIMAPAGGVDDGARVCDHYRALITDSMTINDRDRIGDVVRSTYGSECVPTDGKPKWGMVTDAFGQQLQSDMTFDTYLIDPGNAVSLRNLTVFDPACGSGHFLIYGVNGAGKSHILNAFADLGVRRGERVWLLSAQYLLWRFSTGRLAADLTDCPRVDLLLIDDAQFFSGIKLPAEFKHLFSRLIDCSTWILVACDRSPWGLESVDPLIQALLIGAIGVEVKMPSEAIKFLMGKSKSHAKRPLESCIDDGQEDLQDLATIIASQPEGLWTLFNDMMCSSQEGNDIAVWHAYLPLFELVKEVADLYDVKLSDMWVKGNETREMQARDMAVFLLEDIGRLTEEELSIVFGVSIFDASKARNRIQAQFKADGVTKERMTILKSSFIKRIDERKNGQNPSWSGLGRSQLKLRFGSKNYR